MVSVVREVRARDSVLAWLLEPSNPSARTLTLTELLGRPEDDKDVAISRTAIPGASPARDVLMAQYPQGYWMHPGIGVSPRYRATVWQIIFLAQLGMTRTPPLERAVAHLFQANQREDGAFRASKQPGDTPACLNGALLWALETLGFGQAGPVQRAWSWLAETVHKYGLASTYSDGLACPSGAAHVLWATGAVPEDRRDPMVEQLSQRAAEVLLENPPKIVLAECNSPAEGAPAAVALTFPLAHRADPLQWLSVIVEAGYSADGRVRGIRRWVKKKMLPDGTWPLERTPKPQWATYGAPGAGNKWVTLRALRALAR